MLRQIGIQCIKHGYDSLSTRIKKKYEFIRQIDVETNKIKLFMHIDDNLNNLTIRNALKGKYIYDIAFASNGYTTLHMACLNQMRLHDIVCDGIPP